MLDGKSLEIKNLKEDDRFNDKSYVTDGPKLRYYYGVPLTTSKGLNIGALCVLDKQTLDISPENRSSW